MRYLYGAGKDAALAGVRAGQSRSRACKAIYMAGQHRVVLTLAKNETRQFTASLSYVRRRDGTAQSWAYFIRPAELARFLLRAHPDSRHSIQAHARVSAHCFKATFLLVNDLKRTNAGGMKRIVSDKCLARRDGENIAREAVKSLAENRCKVLRNASKACI